MAEPFLGEIRMASFAFAPKGWALCNGQFLPINQNQALFSLMGTTYGGDGRVNFALPDLRGRTPFHMGGGLTQGERGGAEAHALNISELPSHGHSAGAHVAAPNVGTPLGATWAQSAASAYAATYDAGMNATAVGNTGGNQPHANMSPYTVINFVVALQGIFPSPN